MTSKRAYAAHRKIDRVADAGSPDAASVWRGHGLSWLAAEGLLELGHVAHYAIHAPPARRMRVGADGQP
jgi:hypothetical protein